MGLAAKSVPEWGFKTGGTSLSAAKGVAAGETTPFAAPGTCHPKVIDLFRRSSSIACKATRLATCPTASSLVRAAP